MIYFLKVVLHIHFLGINGKGVHNTAKIFSYLKRAFPDRLYLTASDLNPLKDTSLPLDGFYKQDVDPKKYFHPENKAYIITTPLAFNISNPLIEYAQTNKIDIVEFSDFLKILRDLLIEGKEPIRKEYFNEGLEGVKKLFKDLVKSFNEKDLKEAVVASKVFPFYQYDFKDFILIGITGTDGKTTTSSMIYHVLKETGNRVSMITTISAKWFDGDSEHSTTTGLHTTTPSTDELLAFFEKFKEEKIRFVILEVTSHALVQLRVAGIKFDVAVITNIDKEHLDYHRNFERYRYAKTLIALRHIKPGGTLVVSEQAYDGIKDIFSKVGERRFKIRRVNFGTKGKYGIDINRWSFDVTPTIHYTLRTPSKNFHGNINTYFDFMVFNLALASNVLDVLGIPFNISVKKLESFKFPTGRSTILSKNPLIMVDFAHTPLALEALLKVLSKVAKERGGKLRVVFGCAGERDKTKRKAMGEIAARYADSIYLTAEDPRRERLYDINREILEGIKKIEEIQTHEKYAEYVERFVTKTGKVIYSFFKMHPDSRKEAIKKAIKEASPNDVVAITGKGHEQSLAFGITEYPWNDIEAVRELI